MTVVKVEDIVSILIDLAEQKLCKLFFTVCSQKKMRRNCLIEGALKAVKSCNLCSVRKETRFVSK